MEKLLRFRRSNGSEAYYPLSSFLGATAFAGDTGQQSMRLHFKPLRAYNMEQPATNNADSDFDTDTISIALTDISINNSISRAMRNLMRSISANSTGVVDVFILGEDSIITNAFTSKREKFDETTRISTPGGVGAVSSWINVLIISTVRR